ncbi:Phosphoadenosine phosphosulfate reductase family protein [compost metagenome]
MGDTSNECPASCKNVATRLPIVEVSTPSVFEFLRQRGDKINPLYSRGHKRVGCFPCVLAGKNSLRLVASDPVGRDNLLTVQAAVQVIHWARQEAFFEHDLEDILSGRSDPFGLLSDAEETEEQAGGCSWCNL